MARLYEFEVTDKIVGVLARDIGLSLPPNTIGNIADNLMEGVGQPNSFQKTLMDGKPGFHVRVGKIQTDIFTGQGLHMYVHSGSEGYLDSLEFDKRLRSCLERRLIPFVDRTYSGE